MGRRSRAGGKSSKRTKLRRRRRNAPKPARGPRSSAAARGTNVARLIRERDEALAQLSAASEVLGAISSSPGELEPVFQAVLENAVRICKAKFGNLYLREGDGFRAAAMYNAPPAYAEQRAGILHPSPRSTVGKAIQTKQPAQTADITKLPGYLDRDPWLISAFSQGGYRSVLGVPMLHDDELIGCISIFRQEAGAFADKQVELLANFAKQAVIAIENTRLLNELRDSLEQQTATSEVLRVIASSRTDTQPAFEAMVARAARLCKADFSAVARLENGLLHLVAMNNLSPAEREAFDNLFPRPAERNFAMGRAFIDGVSVQFEDVLADPTYDPHTREVLQRPLGYRTFMAVPIMRNGKSIGTIGCGRRKVMPFTRVRSRSCKHLRIRR